MAFMVPVVKNEWDLYGASPQSRDQAKRAARRRRSTSEASSSMSRGPSFTRQQTPVASSPLADGPWCTARPGSARVPASRSSSRGSNLSAQAFSPPARAVKFSSCVAHSQPAAVPEAPTSSGRAAASQPSSFTGFMERMMRALTRSNDGRESKRSAAASEGSQRPQSKPSETGEQRQTRHRSKPSKRPTSEASEEPAAAEEAGVSVPGTPESSSIDVRSPSSNSVDTMAADAGADTLAPEMPGFTDTSPGDDCAADLSQMILN